MTLSRRLMLTVSAVLTLGRTAQGQTAVPLRLRATIASVTPTTLTVVTRAGETVSLALPDTVSVAWIVPTPLSSIQPNAFIGVTGVPWENGSLKALEVHVFPEAMRGAGEGHRPWDLGPGSTMTNGTVGSVKITDGRLLTVGYKGGEQTIFVPESAPVVTYEPTNRAALTVGAHVIVFGTEAADGAKTATRVSVGKDGLVPPM
jgi:Domain of unknown function (DUF5666)